MGHCHPRLCRRLFPHRNYPASASEIPAELIQVTALRASTNNKATTVLDVFLEAVREYGLPSRVRGDRGAENKKVSVYMILTRGLGRASFMWGSYVFLLASFELALMSWSQFNT
jgi:hypothetical protein